MPRSLLKIFAIVAAAASTTGCAIVGTCDKDCRLEEAARMMSQSKDVGVQAVGIRTLSKLHPELDQEAGAVRKLAVPTTLQCTTTSVEEVDGKKRIKLECQNPPALK